MLCVRGLLMPKKQAGPMIRCQVLLTRRQKVRLDREAKTIGISFCEVLRRLIDEAIRTEREAKAS